MMGIRSKLAAGQRRLSGLAREFQRDDNGATAIEYSLIVGLIFLAIVAAVRAFASSSSEVYGEIDSNITSIIE